MQPEPSSSVGAGTSTPSSTGATGPSPGGCDAAAPQLVMLAVMFGIFYFLLIRPQQKRQREVDDMLKALRKGDKVRTTGGIKGEIVELGEAEVWLLIADKVKINVLRTHIGARLENKSSSETKAEEAKPNG
jgi:preprotein translocase subunit YajC